MLPDASGVFKPVEAYKKTQPVEEPEIPDDDDIDTGDSADTPTVKDPNKRGRGRPRGTGHKQMLNPLLSDPKAFVDAIKLRSGLTPELRLYADALLKCMEIFNIRNPQDFDKAVLLAKEFVKRVTEYDPN